MNAQRVTVAAARRLDARHVVALGTGGVTELTADVLRETDEAPADLAALRAAVAAAWGVVALGTGGGVTGLTPDALREPDEAPAELDAL